MRNAVLSLGVVALIVLAGPAAIAQQHDQLATMSPDQMKWADGPPTIPGSKAAVISGNPREAGLFTMRLFLPAGSRVAPHIHGAVEHLTVMYGTFNIGHGQKFDVEKLKALPAGSFVVIPQGHPHFVLVREPTMVQLHGQGPWTITYVDPSDDPTKK
jgi:quercetin dioxygenase-like cupin family protein